MNAGRLQFPRGHILHDYLEARVMPRSPGRSAQRCGIGDLKAAQRRAPKPVKFGTVTPELVAFAVQDGHYRTSRNASGR
jgi:5-methyltetrahydropteroyltriglutamate--homocysteine methyltransferase